MAFPQSREPLFKTISDKDRTKPVTDPQVHIIGGGLAGSEAAWQLAQQGASVRLSEMRGSGDVLGTAQSGLPRFRIADLERQASLMQVAQDDARKLLQGDPTLKTPRGEAARVLLYLMRQDQAIQLISVG